MKVLVYTRDGCSLCEKAFAVLSFAQTLIAFDLESVDIDSDPVLHARYRYDIPVVLINGRKASKHRLELPALLERLRREGGTPVAVPRTRPLGDDGE